MKRAALIVAGLVALVVIALAIALSYFDAEQLRAPLQSQASAALGREVELGRLSLDVFPRPALHVSAIRIAGHAKGVPAFAEVAELRLRIAILPLLARRVVLRALEVDSPRVHIPFAKNGQPILPGVAAAKPVKPGAAPESEQREKASGAAGFAFAVDRIAIQNARVQAGPWLIDQLDLVGRLRLDGSADFALEATLPEVLKLTNGKLRITGLDGDSLGVAASGAFRAELDGVREKLGLDFALAGTASGDFAAELEGANVRAARLSFESQNFKLKRGELALDGPIHGDAALGDEWSLDLTSASLVQGANLKKAPGVKLVLSGTLGDQASLAALRAARVKIGPNELPLEFALAEQPQRLKLGATVLDLAALGAVLPPDKPKLGGKLAIESFDVTLAPLRAIGAAELQAASIALANGPVEVTGPLRANGNEIALIGAKAKLGGELVDLNATYFLDSGTVRASYSTAEANLEALIAALSGRRELSGVLGASGEVALPGGALEQLSGRGKLAIRPGKLQGFSLVGHVLGELAALPALVASAKGKDLAKYQSDSFNSLTADYRIENGVLRTDNLELTYRHGTAYLAGAIGLFDRSLDLRGKLVLTREADADLAGSKRAKQRTIPIAHIGGSYDAPRIELDARTLSALGVAYLGNDKTREQLEKKLGPGAAEAVEGVLDIFLGGPKGEKK